METGREVDNQTVEARRKNNLRTCPVQRLRMRRKRSELTFFSSFTATEDGATARLTEAADMALDGDDETLAKDNAKLEAADQSQQALQQPHCDGG